MSPIAAAVLDSGGWDTRERAAGGLTALREEHERILQELEEMNKRLSELKKKMEDSGERNSD